MEIKFPGIERIFSDIVKWLFKDRRKILPYKEVIIGTFKKDGLAVDIRAKIFLEEKVQPPVEIFLDRISIKNPYCTKCARILDIVRASWMADFLQTGYKCISCQAEIKIDYSDLMKEIKGEVRQKYSDYWQNYHEAIYDLTGGKPQKYKLE